MKESDFQKFVLQQEKRRVREKQLKEEARKRSLWQTLVAAKKWLMFLVINSVLTNNRK